STHEMVQAVYRSRFPIVRPWVRLGRLPICVQHPHLAHGPIHRVNALQADIACPTTTKIVQIGHRSPQTKRYFSHTHLAGQRWLIQRRVMHRDERTKMALVSKLVQMIIVTLESVEHAVAQCVSIVSSLYRETAPHTPQGDVEERCHPARRALTGADCRARRDKRVGSTLASLHTRSPLRYRVVPERQRVGAL